MIGRTVQAVCCAVLALGAGTALGQAAKPAAVVNGVTITVDEVETELRQSPMAVPPTAAHARTRHMEALGLLIDNVLMRQFLDKAVGPVNNEAVAKRLADLEAGLARDGKSLAEFCQDTNQTVEILRAGVADHVRWSAYAAGKLGDEALERFHRDNKDFFDKATVKASHIVLRVPAGASEAERAKAKAKLEQLRAHLASDPMADFAALARDNSQDGNAAAGGDLGWFPRKWAMDEEFARAAFALPVGGVSDVVKTEFGFHLIKVTDRRAGTPRPFAEVKEAVRAFMSEDLRQQVLGDERKAAAAAGTIKINLP